MTKEHKSRFEWLKQYRNLHDEIVYLKWRVRKAKSEAVRYSSGDLSHVRQERASNSSGLQAEIDRCTKSLHECEAEQAELLTIVDAFTGSDQQILKLKYIQGMTLEEIAEELGCSAELVRKKHAELHRRLDFLDDFDKVQLRIEQRKDAMTMEDREAERDPHYYD